MGRKCFVAGCSSVELDENFIYLEKVSFHKLNVKRETYKEWIAAITIVNNQANALNHPKSAVICSKHFTDDCFIKGSYRGRKLLSNAVPSIFSNSHNVINVKNLVEEQIPLSTISDNIKETETEEKTSSTSGMTNTNMTQPSMLIPLTKTSSCKRKYIRYTGDVGEIKNASSRTLKDFVKILKKDNSKKANTIRELQKVCGHKTKLVQNLKRLYTELKTKSYRSKDREHMLQIKNC